MILKWQSVASTYIEHYESMEKSDINAYPRPNLHKENGGKMLHEYFILPHSWKNILVAFSHISKKGLKKETK